MVRDLNSEITLNNCLLGSVKQSKNVDLNKYKYKGYDTGFDSRLEFLLNHGGVGKNAIIFEPDMSSSVHIDNNEKKIS